VNGGDEGRAGMKTVECLRGRLLAERVASKEDADQLSKRVSYVTFSRTHSSSSLITIG
jgi:hypothetical protein